MYDAYELLLVLYMKIYCVRVWVYI